MKLYFKRGVTGGFIITILTIGGLGIYSYIGIQQLIAASNVQGQSLKIASQAEQVLVNMMHLETGERGYVITGDSSFLEPYGVVTASINDNISSLIAAAEGDEAKSALVEELKSMVQRKTGIIFEIMQARRESFEKAQAIVMKGEGKKTMDGIRGIVRRIQALEATTFGSGAVYSVQQLDTFRYAFAGALVIPAVIVLFLFYSINNNLNKREEASGQLSKANQEITQLNKDLEAFTYSVSHDLRAPLRSVDGYANILLEDYGHVLDDEAKRTIAVIAKNGRRMGRLIDDLLDFSRLGRKELQWMSLSMEDMVNTVISEIRETPAYNPNASIEIKSLPVVTADHKMMRQVWHNLISNALKYSGKSEKPAVEIGSFTRDNNICYYVRDNGVGFNMQYVSKLFGVFQRLHHNEEFEGTGAGLALTKRIIDRHAGTVWAEGALNEGATFYFSLPQINTHGRSS
ncbi:MAG TPA: CHASE3 domain-containing protein [Cyclobacteriaceae bacterium]|nr:CHASE3 domain-containing protein [Cyclobacteriaceae bacterium]